MTDLLIFLNTANAETLTKVPGVTRTIAEDIIATRPFLSVEECLEVKGVGKSLLSKMELFAEAQENKSGNRSLIPVEEEAMPVLMEKSQTQDTSNEDKPSFLSKVGRAFANFFRALLRLILIGLLIVAIGALFYYGMPYLYKTFMAPVQQNTIKTNSLEVQISALQTQQSDLDTRLSALEDSIETYTASIEKLETMQTSIESQILENNNLVLLELKHEVMLSRALDTLARSRLYLAQSNFGSAKEDVQSARDILSELQSETSDEVLNQVVIRLNLALGNLPQFPVVASGDLEIAWQILMTGEATTVATSTPTPFVEPFLTATPTPLDVPSVTPTP